MSLHSACIDEPNDTYTFSDLKVSQFKEGIPGNSNVKSTEMVEYGSAGVRHLQQLSELAGQPNTVLRAHVFDIARATNASERETGDNLRKLLSKHAEEWRDFLIAQGKCSFINSWIERGAL
jgi:hypothetical protein